jgi:hypothetical protein
MKSSSAETSRRVEKVFELRLGGAEFADIRQFAAAPEQQWDVSDRQLWRYLAAADELVRKRFDARADYLLNRHLLQRRTLYAHAVGAGDFGTALRILDSEAKLEGLFERGLDELARQVNELQRRIEKISNGTNDDQEPTDPAAGGTGRAGEVQGQGAVEPPAGPADLGLPQPR